MLHPPTTTITNGETLECFQWKEMDVVVGLWYCDLLALAVAPKVPTSWNDFIVKLKSIDNFASKALHNSEVSLEADKNSI
jgi:hypothetical protein